MSQTIISELGLDWDEGMTIPVANAENKFYEDDVSSKLILKFFSVWLKFNTILDSNKAKKPCETSK